MKRGPAIDPKMLQTIRDLAAQGTVVREIADKVNLSRARIYQICKTYDIQFADGNAAKRKQHPLYFSTIARGTAAELIVAADLIMHHYNVYIPLQRSRDYDLIAVSGDSILTIEVKSATREQATGKAKFNRYNPKSQYLAILCEGQIIYEPGIVLHRPALSPSS